jgi:glutamate/tyrosine decarboxylase-like PLP-dependent enzyme
MTPPGDAAESLQSRDAQPPAIDIEEFRRLGHRAVELAAEHLARQRSGPVFRPMSAEERRTLWEETLPAGASNPDLILDAVAELIMSHPMGNGHPRWFGWVNSPPAPFGALGEFLAATLNPSCAGGDHAAIYLERCAVRWLMELVGFPIEGSIGLLVSGGSMASLTGLAAARHWASSIDGWNDRELGLQSQRPPLVLYLTEEGHACVRKSAELLGIGSSCVRVVPTDDDFRMDLNALRAAIAQDRAAGRRPFCVAATAGTVNTGAIDPLASVADLCEQEKLWLHVDGAYGSFGVLDASKSWLYDGLSRAHSLALDPHKWLSVPVECGCVLVRDAALLRDTFSLVPPYLRSSGGGFGNLPWLSEYGFQQTRGFRALKLWMTLKHAGRSALVELVTRHNSLAQSLAARLDANPDFERLATVTLSIVCFRYIPSQGGEGTDLDALNKSILEQVQSGGEAFLTSTVIRGRFALRACILHYGTTEADLDSLIETIRAAGRCFRA